MGDYMVIGIVLVFVVLMSILPKPVYNAITRAFSMHKNGIRRIQKYRTTTDSIGNLMLGISIVFCIFYCFIPFYSFLYGIYSYCIFHLPLRERKKPPRLPVTETGAAHILYWCSLKLSRHYLRGFLIAA